MTAKMRAKKTNSTIVWAILGLLILSLTGFGVRSVGHGGSQSVGSVGNEHVTVDAYVRALNNRMRALSQQLGQNINFEQARLLGVDGQVLQQVLATAALDGENARIGLSVGDEQVKSNLLATEAFLNLSGKFDETAYSFALEQANLNPAEYDEIIRTDSSRSLLQSSVVSGIEASETYALALLHFVGENRSFRWASIDPGLLAEPTREPTLIEIKAHYKANPDTYTEPQKRQITYVLLTPDMLASEIAADEEALRRLYDEQIDQYVVPERRIADRLVFGSEADAQTALADIASGAKTFEQTVTERGLTIEDIDLGEVAKGDLNIEAANSVFAMTEPGMVGPVKSSLGPALFRINAVLEQRTTTFEQARSELHAAYVADAARRQIDDDIVNINDLLAGGAELEEIAGESAMVLANIDYAEGNVEGVAAYEEFRDKASRVTAKDFPEVHTLSDGGIFALRLNGILEPTLNPLAEVHDHVIVDWKASKTRKRLIEMAENTKTQLDSGRNFEALALSPSIENEISRENFIDGAPAQMVTRVFELDLNSSAVVSEGDTVVLVKLTDIQAFDENTTQNKEIIVSPSARYSRQIGSDILDAYVAALQENAGISLNQQLIEAIHTQIQ